MTKLAFGYHAGIPEGIETVWGARLIGPCDLLHDRQDLAAKDDSSKKALVEWLNGGAIKATCDRLRTIYNGYGEDAISSREEREVVLYEDARGIIVGNTNASGGYVYVAGWLKPGASTVSYELVRETISAERWEKIYGWSAIEAAKMDGEGSEARLYRVDGAERTPIECTVREYGSDGFEMGYGGTGPHASAKAIIADLFDADLLRKLAPFDHLTLVPEVFYEAAEKTRVTVHAADVADRAAGVARAAIKETA